VKYGIHRNAISLLILWPVLILLSPSLSAADDSYRYSIEGFYQNTENDSDVETTLLLGGFRYYFQPVALGNGPYQEADFLDRQTNILGGFGTAEVDVFSVDVDGNIIMLEFEYADQRTPFTFGVNYTTMDADETISGITLDVNLDMLSFELGYYLTPQSRLSIRISQEEADIDVGGLLLLESDTDTYGIGYKNLTALGQNRFVNLELGFDMIENSIDEKNTEISLLADYYLNLSTGLRAGFAVNSGDDVFLEGTTLTVGVTAFLSKTAGINFELKKFSADEDNNDEDTIIVSFEARF